MSPPRRPSSPLPVLLPLLVAIAAAPRPGAAARLGDGVWPTLERLRLEVDPRGSGYRGHARIELEVRRETAQFAFHARDMELERVALSGPSGPVPLAHEPGPEGRVEVRPGRPLPPGAYALEVDFANDFDTRATALYRMVQGEHAYAFTDLEPIGARSAFPCFDEPQFKVPFELEAVVPAELAAVGNAPEERVAVADGRRTVRFRRTRPISTYLFALAVGPFDFVPIPGLSVPARVVTPRGQAGLVRTALEMTPPLLAALEEWFGRPYPFEKLDFIAVPEFWPGAMENPGAVTFSAGILLLDPARVSAAQKRQLAHVIAHELAHMWFGNLVTMRWWDDLWLNESFADWMAEKAAERAFPELGVRLARRDAVQRAMAQDARASAEPVRRPVEHAEDALRGVGVAYAKGKVVLDMFETWMGPERFREGIRDYLKAHAYGSAVAADLWAALGRAAGADVGAAMTTFVAQPGLPLVAFEPRADGSVRVAQRRFSAAGSELPPLSWRIPIALREGRGEGARTTSLLLDRRERTLRLEGGAPEWLVPAASGSGYYRWTLPPRLLRELVARAPERLDVAERVALVGNLWALVEGGELAGGEALDLLAGLAADPAPEVVGAVLATLSRLRVAFVDDGLEPAFAAWLRAVLAPALERVGLLPRAGEPEAVAALRPHLLEWLGGPGRDAAVLAFARERAAADLARPDGAEPALASVVLALHARDGGRPLFEELRGRVAEARLPAERRRYLAALGSFRDPALQEEALRFAAEGPLRPNEIFAIPEAMEEGEADRERIWRWLGASFERVAGRLPPAFLAFLPGFARGCEPGRVEEARAFFAAPARRADGTAAQLEKVADEVRECVALRAREGERVRERLLAAANGR